MTHRDAIHAVRAALKTLPDWPSASDRKAVAQIDDVLGYLETHVVDRPLLDLGQSMVRAMETLCIAAADAAAEANTPAEQVPE